MQWPHEVTRFLETIHGNASQSGYVQISYCPPAQGGEDPWEHRGRMFLAVTPNGILWEEMPALSLPWQEYEWFFTPSLLSARRERSKALVLEGSTLFVDFDDGVDLQALDPRPSIVVETSPGKYHCYWLLDQALTPGTVEDLNYQLKTAYPGDNTHDCSRILRLPMGAMSPDKVTRRSRGPVPGIKWLSDLRYSTTDFAHLPQVRPMQDSRQYGDIPPVPTESERSAFIKDLEQQGKMPARLKRDLTREAEGSRYLTLTYVYNEGFRQGLSPTQVWNLVHDTPNDKWADNPHTHEQELWRDINQAYDRYENEAEPASVLDRLHLIRMEKLPGQEKSAKLGKALVEDMKKIGEFFQTKDPQLCWFRDVDEKKLIEVTNRGVDFTQYMVRKYEIDASGQEYAVAVNFCEAEAREGPVKEVHRFTYWDQRRGKLYINRYDGHMYVLDGERIEVIGNGEQDVLFLQDHRAEPYRFAMSDNTNMELWKTHVLENLNLQDPTAATVIHHVALTWITSLFFPELMAVKPILFVHGPPGSGKTSFFKAVNLILRLGHYDVDSLPDNEGEFNRIVGQRDYLFFDNVDDYHSWLANNLAKLATGYSYTIRKLYTTQEMLTTEVRCSVGLTAHSPKFMRSDVAERTIPIPVEHRHDFLDEQEMEEGTQKVRAELWGELIAYLNAVITLLKGPNTAPKQYTQRMASFAKLLHYTCKISQVNEEACLKFVRLEQAKEIEGGDPLVYCLKDWLADDRNIGRELTINTLWQELVSRATGDELRRNGLSVRGLGMRLKNLERHWTSMGLVMQRQSRSDRQFYTFTRGG